MGRDKIGSLESSNERDPMDFYATNPSDVEQICQILGIDKGGLTILEPCAGNGHIAKVLEKMGHEVTTNDIIERDYPLDYTLDYLDGDPIPKEFNVVLTNPPFKYAKEFIEKSLDYAPVVIILAKIDLLETAKRKDLNNNHLQRVFIHSQRARFALGGDEKYFKKSTSMATAWYMYVRNKKGKTRLEVI